MGKTKYWWKYHSEQRQEQTPPHIWNRLNNSKKGGVKSSVKKYIYSCYKGIEDKIIMNENDPTNLRPYEAFYKRKYKQSLTLPWIMQRICEPFVLVF